MKIETPVLRRLGPVPFWRGERKCLDALESVYRKVREGARALEAGGGRENPPLGTTPNGRRM